MLRRHGAAVYWVGLPVMRDESFDADAHAMDAFYRQLMAGLDVPFVDIRPLTVDGNGRYEAYYDDGAGGQKLFRANDGIHMSMNGYLHVTRGLAQVIRASVADARGAKADADPARTAMIALLAAAAFSFGACSEPLCGGETLAPVMAKLARARTGTGRPVHILQIGDSHTAGDAITGAWRDTLQQRFGIGGRGVLPPGAPMTATRRMA